MRIEETFEGNDLDGLRINLEVSGHDVERDEVRRAFKKLEEVAESLVSD